ncbi:hypothetical protein LQ772_04715 [Frateuria edaphi]|uniref:hypothetical protein n=1 Tax=Frateuria edaphi TaxID=2898793 RepID=UPI001E3891C0|nr:hypothetical protein [Frateuria edaphi]UGB46601.1 hypothetical protein LQ772_04715 [Frateuria edaphi]
MSADFDAIVRMCRLAAHCELQGASLRIEIETDQEVDRLAVAASAYRHPDIYVGGRQQHRALSTIAPGTVVELRFDGLTSNQKVIAQSLEQLLSYQQGLFLYKAPPEYFLLHEGYATGDDHVPDLVRAYQRVPRLFELIRTVSDVVLGDGTAAPTFVVLGGKRLDFAAKYDIETLKILPPVDSVDALSIELQSPPFVEAKKSLFKKALVRLLEATPQEQRFAELVKRFEAARQIFAADFDLYSTEFNFEKVRESFEQKRLAFVLQLNATTSDLLGKMLAIPVGQGIIVSQLKNDPEAAVGNIALLFGSWVFAAFAALLLFNQCHSLKQIKQEIKIENDSLETRFPQLHRRISEMFALLQRRAALHTWAFPAVVAALLIATTAYSTYAFTKVPPYRSTAAPTTNGTGGAARPAKLNPKSGEAIHVQSRATTAQAPSPVKTLAKPGSIKTRSGVQ